MGVNQASFLRCIIRRNIPIAFSGKISNKDFFIRSRAIVPVQIERYFFRVEAMIFGKINPITTCEDNDKQQRKYEFQFIPTLFTDVYDEVPR